MSSAKKCCFFCKIDLYYNYLFIDNFNYSEIIGHPKDMPRQYRGIRKKLDFGVST